jgi:transcriptional regulator GlxA family with amidase domain
VTVTPGGIPSWYDLPEPGFHLVVHFGLERSGRAHEDETVSLPLHARLGRRQAFARHQLTEIAHLHARAARDGTAPAAAAQLLQGLLLWLATEGAARRADPVGQTDEAVRWAAALIEQRIGRGVAVHALAREVGLSQNYLARCFRRRFGVTIPRYLLLRRIETARDLLESTGSPVGEVGRRVGLPDPHHFNKQFRRILGVSPTDWRRGRRGAAEGE